MSMEILEEYITNGDVSGLTNLLLQNPELATGSTSHGVSPLMLSCYYKQPKITEVLLTCIENISLFEAAASGQFDTVAYLVTTHPEKLDDYADDGFTALGLACYFGHFEVARLLILKGADVNLPSKNGFNVYPIHSAAAGNYTNILRLLIESGAHVNVKQQAGSTPLHAAAQYGNLDMLIILLENGAEVNIRMEGGKLPSDLAREKGYDEIAEILA